MSTRFCTACGQQSLVPNAPACGNCGKPFAAPAVQHEPVAVDGDGHACLVDGSPQRREDAEQYREKNRATEQLGATGRRLAPGNPAQRKVRPERLHDAPVFSASR